jgi:formate hydrogenlyase transcriptional activator
VLSPADKRPVMEMGRSVTIDQTLSAQAFLEQRPQLLTRNDLSALTAPIATRMLDAGIQTVLCMPMVTSKGAVGTLNVGSKRDRAFSPQDAELLNQIAAQLAIALENARAYREIQALKGAAVGRKALPGRRNSDRTAL